jgi:hypothetical protein
MNINIRIYKKSEYLIRKKINTIKSLLILITIIDLLIFKVNSFYYKLEQNSEKCFLEDINKGSVIK